MATPSRRSLASRAGAAAKRVVVGKPAAKPTKAASATVAAPAKKAAAGTAKATKSTTAGKAAVKKTAAKKTTGTAKTTKKAPAKSAAKKTIAEPSTSTRARATAAAKRTATSAARQASAPAKQAAAVVQKAVPTARRGSPGALVVLPGEDPWTKDELGEVRSHLRGDIKRLTTELHSAEHDLAGLMRDAGEGAGNDQADVGSATFERDQEMTIANNHRDMLTQSEHALERIADGSYGVCESCGQPIGKNRLMVFPRATMCMSCKQREERR